MDAEMRPEPSDAEREAILAALAALAEPAAGERPYLSAWRRAGLPGGDDEAYAAARPRSSPGATRA